MSDSTVNTFHLDSLRSFGLSQAVDFVLGETDQPKDFNLGHMIEPLIAHLMQFDTSPYYSLGSQDKGIYMDRNWLFPKSKTAPAARIHQIHRSDADRAAHNHPWNHFSVILEHGYFELIPALNAVTDLTAMPAHLQPQASSIEPMVAIKRERGDVIFRTPKMRHKLIVLSEQQKPLTLFVTAPKSQEWGFFTEEGFVHHITYLNSDVQKA